MTSHSRDNNHGGTNPFLLYYKYYDGLFDFILITRTSWKLSNNSATLRQNKIHVCGVSIQKATAI